MIFSFLFVKSSGKMLKAQQCPESVMIDWNNWLQFLCWPPNLQLKKYYFWRENSNVFNKLATLASAYLISSSSHDWVISLIFPWISWPSKSAWVSLTSKIRLLQISLTKRWLKSEFVTLDFCTLLLLQSVNAGNGIFQMGWGSESKLTMTGVVLHFFNTWKFWTFEFSRQKSNF